MYVCIYIYIYIYIHTYIHTCIHAYIHVYIHTCVHTYILRHYTNAKHMHVHAHTHTHKKMYTHVFTYTQTNTYIQYTHTYTQECIDENIAISSVPSNVPDTQTAPAKSSEPDKGPRVAAVAGHIGSAGDGKTATGSDGTDNATAAQQLPDACPPGQYSPGTGRLPCTDCPPGTFTGSPGGRFCEKCLQGTWSNSSGASTCMECGDGRSTKMAGAVSMSDCGAYATVCSVCMYMYVYECVRIAGALNRSIWGFVRPNF